jgi:hypothetical protein
MHEKIRHWLQQGELGNLVKHIEDIEAAHQAIHALLPDPFKDACHVHNITQSCIILGVKDPNIMTLLRYEIPNLLAALRKDPRFAGVASIKCHMG